MNPTFTVDIAGDYVIQLIVSDVTSNSEPDSVIVSATVDNSKFYGDFALSVTTDSCKLEEGIITIGGDESRRNEDDYLYIPLSENPATYTKIDSYGDSVTITIEVSGDTFSYDEVGKDWEIPAEYVFSNDHNNFTINGEAIEDEPDECEGTMTGSAVGEGSVGVTFSSYVQYRAYSDISKNMYKGWIDLKKDGIPVEESDVTKIELKDSTGAPVNIIGIGWYSESLYRGKWNSETESVDFSGPIMDPAAYFNFSEGFELPEDDYTFEVTMSWDDIERETIYYPGKKELPFVDSATMNYEWLVDGNLKLSWVNPAGDYDRLRVLLDFSGVGFLGFLAVSLPPDVNELTIPNEWVEIIEDYYEITTVFWKVQTRSYTTDENMNYARAYSDTMEITWSP